ncbi:hypothetical protein IAR55_000925 [Kwoniella newhampshirensis]|uniref:STE/STE11/CDC15 protein kinase n=1 Tax=Kwoniella newhampshirensis TaxID=1651941 RepID=A0AAW0Z4E9_9TREE
MPRDALPSSSSTNTGPSASTPGRGFRGFLSRVRVGSPEPPEPSGPRQRLWSFMGGETTKSSSLSETTTAANQTSRGRPRTLSSEVATGKEVLQRETGRSVMSRPTTPTQKAPRQIRLNPTALPALQKGEDGRWQGPALSRGSMSTSALHLLQLDDEEPLRLDEDKRITNQKHALSNLSQTKAGDRSNAPPSAYGRADGPSIAVGLSAEAIEQSGVQSTLHRSVLDARVGSRPFTTTSAINEFPDKSFPMNPVLRPSSVASGTLLRTEALGFAPDTSARSPITRPPRTRASTASPPANERSSLASNHMPPPPIPAHARRESAPTSLLSRDHYLLRLSASFMVKLLTPVIRDLTSDRSDRKIGMKRLADERLQALGRMEKAWGAEWLRVASTLSSHDQSLPVLDNRAIGSLEAKVRLVYVGERAKERERDTWSDAVKDGLLLCFLLNHLFPSQPSRIARVIISERGIMGATNVTRFLTACQGVGLSNDVVFSPHDLQECSEISLGRVANTIIFLARLAGRESAAFSPNRLPPKFASIGQPPAIRDAASASHTRSPLASPRRPLTAQDSSTSSAEAASHSARLAALQADRIESTELGPNLNVITLNQQDLELDDPSTWKTPTTSTFALPSVPSEMRRSPLTRASTQPNISPSLRPKSPAASPSSRNITPNGRTQARPVLRLRNTTGAKVSVSFADDVILTSETGIATGQTHLGSHSGERTPSLVSSGSRVTSSSAYTRSSATRSVVTVMGEEHAVNLAEEDNRDRPDTPRLHERRISEKKLQNAREKILGTLLSSEDLPHDLRDALRKSATKSSALTERNDERDSALSKSLAALEGNRKPPQPIRIDSSPLDGAFARRGQNPESGRQDFSQVLEEDEQNGLNSDLSATISRPPPLRRLSSNGKVYIPKRSVSPAQMTSPTSVAFPLSSSVPNSSYIHMARGASLHSSQSTTSNFSRPSDLTGRRQSDVSSVHSRDQTFSSNDSSRPLQMRINSMVNLSTMGTPSLFRDNSTQSKLRSSQYQSLQVLEFHESGRPVIRYQLGNCIGRGQFGAVYRSLNLGIGQMVAIKRIRLHGMREDEVTDVMREVELLQRMSHPSIVKYEGMSRDEEYLNIVLEFVENGSLGQTLKAFGQFNEKLVSSYVAKILAGLDYLHSQGVVHCDLKAANILSTKNGNVKLSDFGVSLNMKAVENIKQDAKTEGKTGGAKKRVSEVAGTPNWMAPEVISLTGPSFASDIWSLGCTIIELLTGKPPYADLPNSMSVLFHIVEDDMPPFPRDISDDLTDFLRQCFVKDPKLRPTAALMFEHPWVKRHSPELALRPQDSVPFLRRVSKDLRRVDSSRLFEHNEKPNAIDVGNQRHSMTSSHERHGSDGTSMKAHVLIKTSFGKAIVCRVCHLSVKRVGVLCQDCGLVAHSACASKASPRCSLQEQFTLLSRQQEMQKTPSRGPSPLPIFDKRDGAALAALPTKILNGLKRSKGVLSPSTPSQSDLTTPVAPEIRRHPGRSQNRPSLEMNLSSGSASLRIRSSMYSPRSEHEEDSQRRSGGHVDLDGGDPSSAIGERSSDKMVSVGVVPVIGQGGMSHVRRTESKNDCCIM